VAVPDLFLGTIAKGRFDESNFKPAEPTSLEKQLAGLRRAAA
jgi:hypothetical protein